MPDLIQQDEAQAFSLLPQPAAPAKDTTPDLFGLTVDDMLAAQAAKQAKKTGRPSDGQTQSLF